MLRHGPGVPPSTVVIHRTSSSQPSSAPAVVIARQPSSTPTVVIAPPPLPTPAVVVVAPTPVLPPQASHGVRIVHHQLNRHAHPHGLPKLVGVHKAPHTHHARVVHGSAHARVAHFLPGHAAVRAQQPSLRAIAASHTAVRTPVAPHVPHTPHAHGTSHPTVHAVQRGPVRRPF